MSDVPTFLTVDEVARILDLHPRTVMAHVNRGEIAALRLGRAVRIPVDALSDLIQPRKPMERKTT